VPITPADVGPRPQSARNLAPRSGTAAASFTTTAFGSSPRSKSAWTASTPGIADTRVAEKRQRRDSGRAPPRYSGHHRPASMTDRQEAREVTRVLAGAPSTSRSTASRTTNRLSLPGRPCDLSWRSRLFVFFAGPASEANFGRRVALNHCIQTAAACERLKSSF
jgi:hypothetical protein